MDNNRNPEPYAVVAGQGASLDGQAFLLNGIIAKAITSREEFLIFASKATQTPLSDVCLEIKHRRDDFALRLQRTVSGLGYEPATNENFSGWLHKEWARVRLTFEPDRDYVIATEAIREEESMRDALRDAVQDVSVSADIRPMLAQELAFTEGLLVQLEGLKASLEPANFADMSQ